MKVLDRNAQIAVTRPNWQRPVGVEYSFKTGIFTSRDGHERREAHRQTARVSLKFSTILTRAALTRHMGDLARQQETALAVRVEWQRAELAADHVAGGNTIEVVEVPRWLVSGATLILTTETHEDLFEVSAVVGTTVTLRDVTVRDYSMGTRVNLALWARAAPKVDFRAETAMIWQGNMRYDAIPGTYQEVYAKGTGFARSYRELLLTKPNWRENPRISFTQERDVFDPGFGLVDVNGPHDADQLQIRFGFTGLDSEASDKLVEFFLRHKGRRNAFWMPTWSRDVQPSETLLAGANQFQIDGDDFRTAYTDHPVFKAMIAFWGDGSYQTNQISSIGGTVDSELTFKNNWTNPVLADTQIMWLPMWRFDTDTLDARWLTDSVAEMEFSARTVYAEDLSAFPVSPEFETLRGLVEPVAFSELTILPSTPMQISNLVDLYEYGFTQADIDTGKAKALARWSALYQTGNPLAGGTTTVRMDIVFHAVEPTYWSDTDIDPLGGDVTSFTESQVENILAELAPVTVPPGARYVQFRANYNTQVTESLTNHETVWAVGRAE